MGPAHREAPRETLQRRSGPPLERKQGGRGPWLTPGSASKWATRFAGSRLDTHYSSWATRHAGSCEEFPGASDLCLPIPTLSYPQGSGQGPKRTGATVWHPRAAREVALVDGATMAGCFGQLAATVRPGLLRLNKWTAATRGNPLSAPDGDSRGPEGKEFQIKKRLRWIDLNKGGGTESFLASEFLHGS